MPALSIEALDTLLFRDAKPFNKDGDNWVTSLFPPPPSILYGALRAKYFSENITELSKANEANDPTKSLKIKGIYLYLNDSLFFPMPLDLLRTEGINPEFVPLSLLKNEIVSNCTTEMILLAPNGKIGKNVKDGFIDWLSLQDYLNGRNENLQYQVLADFITPEPKIGIQIDRATNLVKEKCLFRVGMLRPETYTVSTKNPGRRIYHKMKIVVDYEGLNLPSEGLLKVGAENKVAFYSHDIKIEVPEVKLKGPRLKLYLASPAKFEQGWLPGWINKETLIGEYKGVSVKLLSASIGKYLSIGGFDMKTKSPKKMLRAVPAGSVYYFEILGNSCVEDVINKLHYQNISDYDAEQGFGLTFVGGVE